MTGTRMTGTRSKWLAAALLVIVACGGGKKGGSTTPKSTGGSGDPQSMKDTPDPGGGGGNGGNGGNGGGSAGDPNGGGDGSDDRTKPVTFPNQDADPAQVKSQVDQYLAAARNALSLNPPDADGALKQAKQALALDATNLDAAAMIAFAYYHKKLYDTAEVVLDELLKRDSAKQNANVYYVLGLIYDHTSRPEEATLAFKRAVELKPDFASALVDLGVHQLQNKQYADAQSTYEKLTQQLGRKDAVTLTNLGSAYRGRTGDYPPGSGERNKFIVAAEGAYKQALGANPNYGPAFYDLGLLYLDADPFPSGGGTLDPVQRLNAAKGFFDQYKNSRDVDMKLYDERMKDVTKALKRAQKKAGAPTKKKP